MVTQLDDAKRLAIGEKLADMKAVQNLIISNEQRLMQECPDQDVRERLQNMLEDDRKNMGVLETVIVQYGIQSEPNRTTQNMVQQIEQMMSGNELSFYQKLVQHEL